MKVASSCDALDSIALNCSVIIEPESVGFSNVYKVMIGSIVPRPIAFVSTISPSGIRNLSPFSFFTGVCANPPVLCFCPVRNAKGQKKDTLNNIEASGDFVVNVVSEDIVERMNATSAEFPSEIDEFEISGLTAMPGDLVRSPRVEEAHVSMECKLLRIVEISELPMGGSIVVGQIVRLHVDDAYIDNYRIDPDKLKAVGRMAGISYARTSDRFDLARPTL
jgi:flavin reductase (DIM6/NTAB) family NADH-FMN oxidoreductase RutF